MKLNLTPFPSNLFRWNKEEQCLIAEASELHNQHLQRMYDDACDVGLAVRSEKTGNVVEYALTEVDRDGEFEVLCWVYEPTDESVRLVPGCENTSVLVYND